MLGYDYETTLALLETACISRDKTFTCFSIIFIFLLTVLFFYPVIFQEKTFYAFDTLLQYLPWSSTAPPDFQPYNTLITDPVNQNYTDMVLLQKNIKNRFFSFWDGSILGGRASTAGGVSSTFPSNPLVYLFFLLLPITTAHDLLLWIHLFGTGIFIFFYLKKIGLAPYPALLGSVASMFNGYIMAWFEFENVLMLLCSLAATLYYIECWMKSKKYWIIFS